MGSEGAAGPPRACKTPPVAHPPRAWKATPGAPTIVKRPRGCSGSADRGTGTTVGTEDAVTGAGGNDTWAMEVDGYRGGIDVAHAATTLGAAREWFVEVPVSAWRWLIGNAGAGAVLLVEVAA